MIKKIVRGGREGGGVGSEETGWLTINGDEATKSKKKCNRYIDRLFRKTLTDLSCPVSSIFFRSPLLSSLVSSLVPYHLFSSHFISSLSLYFTLVSSDLFLCIST
jgi:hypothetical protein